MRTLILILSLTATALCITGLTIQARAQLNPGDILIMDADVGTDDIGTLFSVDPVTGARTVISDFGNASQGTLGERPFGVALGLSGDILVIDFDAGTNFRGALFSVDPVTGNRTVLWRLATRVGTLLSDNITGTTGPDVINLLGGNDTAHGGDGNDIICGGTGNDTMNGGDGKDRLFGEKGKDTLNGDDGNDKLIGAGGNDNMNGGTGRDNCKGGPGNNDTVFSCETTTTVP